MLCIARALPILWCTLDSPVVPRPTMPLTKHAHSCTYPSQRCVQMLAQPLVATVVTCLPHCKCTKIPKGRSPLAAGGGKGCRAVAIARERASSIPECVRLFKKLNFDLLRRPSNIYTTKPAPELPKHMNMMLGDARSVWEVSRTRTTCYSRSTHSGRLGPRGLGTGLCRGPIRLVHASANLATTPLGLPQDQAQHACRPHPSHTKEQTPF